MVACSTPRCAASWAAARSMCLRSPRRARRWRRCAQPSASRAWRTRTQDWRLCDCSRCGTLAASGGGTDARTAEHLGAARCSATAPCGCARSHSRAESSQPGQTAGAEPVRLARSAARRPFPSLAPRAPARARGGLASALAPASSLAGRVLPPKGGAAHARPLRRARPGAEQPRPAEPAPRSEHQRRRGGGWGRGSPRLAQPESRPAARAALDGRRRCGAPSWGAGGAGAPARSACEHPQQTRRALATGPRCGSGGGEVAARDGGRGRSGHPPDD